MGFDIDTLVLLSKWTLLNPLFSLAYLASYTLQVDTGIGSYFVPRRTDLFHAAIAVLTIWLLSWSSDRWQNRVRGVKPAQELAVITGGASGIGLCTAKQLAAKGTKVIIIDVKASEATDLISPYVCDLSSSDALAKVAKSIRSLHGSPTVLINNAGMTHSQPITTLSTAQISQLINVNLTSQLWMLQEFLPGMIDAARKGNQMSHIVSTASVMGHIGTSQMIDYCASKHGVVGLHKALRYELDYCHRCPQIRTTLLILGHVKTQLFRDLPFNSLARFLGPSVEPDRVAGAIVSSIERRKSGIVALPWYANWTEALNLLPSWASDFIHWLLGANTSMAQMNIRRSASSDK